MAVNYFAGVSQKKKHSYFLRHRKNNSACFCCQYIDCFTEHYSFPLLSLFAQPPVKPQANVDFFALRRFASTSLGPLSPSSRTHSIFYFQIIKVQRIARNKSLEQRSDPTNAAKRAIQPVGHRRRVWRAGSVASQSAVRCCTHLANKLCCGPSANCLGEHRRRIFAMSDFYINVPSGHSGGRFHWYFPTRRIRRDYEWESRERNSVCASAGCENRQK